MVHNNTGVFVEAGPGSDVDLQEHVLEGAALPPVIAVPWVTRSRRRHCRGSPSGSGKTASRLPSHALHPCYTHLVSDRPVPQHTLKQVPGKPAQRATNASSGDGATRKLPSTVWGCVGGGVHHLLHPAQHCAHQGCAVSDTGPTCALDLAFLKSSEGWVAYHTKVRQGADVKVECAHTPGQRV